MRAGPLRAGGQDECRAAGRPEASGATGSVRMSSSRVRRWDGHARDETW